MQVKKLRDIDDSRRCFGTFQVVLRVVRSPFAPILNEINLEHYLRYRCKALCTNARMFLGSVGKDSGGNDKRKPKFCYS